jgi:hypothetical protein
MNQSRSWKEDVDEYQIMSERGHLAVRIFSNGLKKEHAVPFTLVTRNVLTARL